MTTDVLIVGAGFSGISSLYHSIQKGFDVRVLESAPSVGGTWYHNRYPGARCDIESLDYSLSLTEELQQSWRWPERYSSRNAILEYFNYLADELELRDNIEFNTTVKSAEFVKDRNRWVVHTDGGQSYESRYLILATGVLSAAQVPSFKGMDRFAGDILHTAAWPEDDVDFTGKKVAVIGTGSSGTQLIPIVAKTASELTVFQRTANYVMPARNQPITEDVDREWKENYAERRAAARASNSGHNQAAARFAGKDLGPAQRDEELEGRWQAGGVSMMRVFTDVLTDPEVNEYASSFVANKIRSIVEDPAVAEKLVPKNLPIGTKRLCSGTNYYETFNLPHVRLVDVSENPITDFSETGINTTSDAFDFDVVILATGFDAMTGSFLKIDIHGLDGRTLREHWEAGPRTYMGVGVNGFPNMFIHSGPQSPSVFSNMATTAEMQAEWITEFIQYLEANDFNGFEADEDAESAWVEHVTELVSNTLYEDSRNSWFWGANIPGKPRVFMPYPGGVGNYMNALGKIAAENYEGFIKS